MKIVTVDKEKFFAYLQNAGYEWAELAGISDYFEMSTVKNDDRLPETYAEIDYGDREDAEAIEGAKWDDKNYQHYMER